MSIVSIFAVVKSAHLTRCLTRDSDIIKNPTGDRRHSLNSLGSIVCGFPLIRASIAFPIKGLKSRFDELQLRQLRPVKSSRWAFKDLLPDWSQVLYYTVNLKVCKWLGIVNSLLGGRGLTYLTDRITYRFLKVAI